MTDYHEMTSKELREPLLRAIVSHVPFDGWTDAAVERGAKDLGIDPKRARLSFPGGMREMIALHSALADAALGEVLDKTDLSTMKIREKVTFAVRARLELIADDRMAIERAALLLANPRCAGLARRLIWNTADAIWRGIGDQSTDYNYYSKRTILSTVYSTTLTAFLGDSSDGFERTWAFLDRRIAGVMRFEKTKAKVLKRTDKLPNPVRFLGRLRYGRA